MNKDLLVDGRRLISAKFASQKSDYSQDHIAALARSGKIPGTLIGRTWYVDLEALQAHKERKVFRSEPKLPDTKYTAESAPLVPTLARRPEPSQWDFNPSVLKHALLGYTAGVAIIAGGLFIAKDFAPAFAERSLNALTQAGEKQEEMVASTISAATLPYRQLATSGFFQDVYGGFGIVTDFIADFFTEDTRIASDPKYIELSDLAIVRDNLRSELLSLVPTSTPLEAPRTVSAPETVVVYQTPEVDWSKLASTQVVKEIYRDFHHQTDRNVDLIPRAIDTFREDIEESFNTLDLISASSTLTSLFFSTAVGTSATITEATTTSLFSTTASFNTLNLTQLSNGSNILRASRITDIIPTGDFISYWNAAGDTQLFRVDNSGNIYAGGIANSGAITITSVTTPQLRVQYDASNEITTAVSSTGTITTGIIGTTPRAIWMPSANSTSTYQFQNAAGTSALTIDTTNLGITTVNSTSTNATSTNLFASMFKAGNGSAALPSISFSDDSDTGFYSAGTNRLGISTGGVARFEWNASGHFLAATDNAYDIGASGATRPRNVYAGTEITAPYIQAATAFLAPGGSVGSPAFEFNGFGSVGIYAPASDTFAITTSGAERVRVNSSGNVGIGRTNPKTKLDIDGELSLATTTAIQFADVFNNGSLTFRNGATSIGSITPGASSGGGFNLSTFGVLTADGNINNTGFGFMAEAGVGMYRPATNSIGLVTTSLERVRITSTGNVGIGTTTPEQKLEVVGNIELNTGTNNYNYIMVPAAQELVFQFGSKNNPGYGVTNTRFSTKGGGYNQVDWGGAGVYQYDPYGSSFHMGYSGIAFTSTGGFAGTNPISFDSADGFAFTSGSVGIGTTSPSTKLNVIGDVQFQENVQGSNSAGLYFDNYYAVSSGFGTKIQFRSTDNSNRGHIALEDASGGGAGSYMKFTVPNSSAVEAERMRIDVNGNVGIGTTTPGARLEVKGTGTGSFMAGAWGGDAAYGALSLNGNITLGANLYSPYGGSTLYINRPTGGAIRFREENGTDQVSIISGGNVGIGHSSPVSALVVSKAGTIDTTGASGKWTARLHDATTATAGVGGSLLFQGYKSAAGAVGNFAGIAGLKENATDTNEQGYLALYTVPSSGVITERMRIDSTGNVGIGTTVTTGARLSVVSNLAATSPQFSFQADSSDFSYGQIFINGYSNVNQRLAIGYNTSADYGFINSYKNGTASMPLSLNPGGGTVGIGTTTSEGILSVKGPSGSTNYIRLMNDSTNNDVIRLTDCGTGIDSGIIALKDGGTTKVNLVGDDDNASCGYTYFNAGNVGIGDTSPAALLSVGSGDLFQVTSGGNVSVVTGATINLNGVGGNTKIYAIGGSGQAVQHEAGGTATMYEGAWTSGSIQFPNVGTTASAANVYMDNASSNLLLRVTSSLRYKTDVRTLDMSEAVRVVTGLRPVLYKSLASADDPHADFLGLIAEEVALIDPRLVNYDAEGRPDGVQYERFVVHLIGFSQNLEARLSQVELNLASASTSLTVSTSTPGLLASVYEAFGATVQNAIVYFKDVVIEKLTVGREESPAGITLYDKATGAPYCFEIVNGASVTTSGACGPTSAPVVSGGTSTPEPAPTPEPTASSTEPIATTTEPVVEEPVVEAPAEEPVVEEPVSEEPVVEGSSEVSTTATP